MFSRLPPAGPNARGTFSAKRARSYVSMPGCNPLLLNEGAKKARTFVGTNVGRPNPDTPQNVVSTTCVFLPPPASQEVEVDENDVYAPASKNPAQANVPNRGEIAVCVDGSTPEGAEWIAMTNGATYNAGCNAVPAFTNMALVPKHLRIKYVGVVGNAGKHSKNPGDGDQYGQVYSAGCVTTRNSGPEYIPPLTPVYICPHSFVRTDATTGAKTPGYIDPGAESAGIDKYLVSVYPLKNTDVSVFFHHIETKWDQLAQTQGDRFLNSKWIEEEADKFGVHKAIPAWHYIVHYGKQAYMKACHRKLAADPTNSARMKEFVDSANMVIKQNQEYWKTTEKSQREMANALGGNGMWTKRENALETELVNKTEKDKQEAFLKFGYAQLLSDSFEIMKLQFADQMNFIRSQCFGVSRYGCASTQQLDVMTGYRQG